MTFHGPGTDGQPATFSTTAVSEPGAVGQRLWQGPWWGLRHRDLLTTSSLARRHLPFPSGEGRGGTNYLFMEMHAATK